MAQGTDEVLELANNIRQSIDDILNYHSVRIAATRMALAADVLERIAPFEVEINVIKGEE